MTLACNGISLFHARALLAPKLVLRCEGSFNDLPTDILNAVSRKMWRLLGIATSPPTANVETILTLAVAWSFQFALAF